MQKLSYQFFPSAVQCSCAQCYDVRGLKAMEKAFAPVLVFTLLLRSSPFEAIFTTGSLLSFTRLAATDLAYEFREQ